MVWNTSFLLSFNKLGRDDTQQENTCGIAFEMQKVVVGAVNIICVYAEAAAGKVL